MAANSYQPKVAGATTATGNSKDYKNADADRAFLVASVTGSPTGTSPAVVVKLQGKTKAGVYYDIPSAATSSLTAAGTTIVAVSALPRTWRAVWTVSGTTPSINLAVSVDAVG